MSQLLTLKSHTQSGLLSCFPSMAASQQEPRHTGSLLGSEWLSVGSLQKKKKKKKGVWDCEEAFWKRCEGSHCVRQENRPMFESGLLMFFQIMGAKCTRPTWKPSCVLEAQCLQRAEPNFYSFVGNHSRPTFGIKITYSFIKYVSWYM